MPESQPHNCQDRQELKASLGYMVTYLQKKKAKQKLKKRKREGCERKRVGIKVKHRG